MAFEFFSPASGGRHNATSRAGILMAIDTNRNGAGKNGEGLRLRLSAEVMNRMRWMPGDRIRMGFDRESRLIKIIRVPAQEPGYRLHSGGNGKKGCRLASCVRIRASVFPADVWANLTAIIAPKPYVTEDIVYETDGIMFDWPRAKP